MELPPGRCVVVAGKPYPLDEGNGERRALAAMKTHGIQATTILIDGRSTTERLRAPDRTNPPPRLLALIGKRFGTREVIALKRRSTPSENRHASIGQWVAVLRCAAGHVISKTPGLLSTIEGCGACRLERQRENRARVAASKRR